MLINENYIKENLKLDMTNDFYQEIYNELISWGRKSHPGTDGKAYPEYLEKHHIVPKCVGGKDEEENFVLLTYTEHVIAHVILFLQNPKNYKLAFAANIMVYGNEKVPNVLGTKNNILNLIKDINIEILDEISHRLKETLGKKVACIDPNFDDIYPEYIINGDSRIVKIYNSIYETKEDGFTPTIISSVIKTGLLHKNYLWKLVEDCDQEDINKYKRTVNKYGIPKNILLGKDTRIVCHSFSGKVYKVYKTVQDIPIKDISRLISTIDTDTPYGKYYWSTPNNIVYRFPNIDGIEFDNYENVPDPIFYSSYLFACLDPQTKQIIKIYENSYGIVQDGFERTRVVTRADGEHECMGYIWMNCRKLSLEQLEEYYNREKYENPVPKELYLPSKETIIRFDPSTKEVSKIYYAPNAKQDILNDGFRFKAVTQAIKGTKGLETHYKFGWKLYKDFQKMYPDKLKKFENEQRT